MSGDEAEGGDDKIDGDEVGCVVGAMAASGSESHSISTGSCRVGSRLK